MPTQEAPLSGEELLEAVTASMVALQDAMQDKFIGEIERLCGREVIAFISNQHVGSDIEVELFVLREEESAT